MNFKKLILALVLSASASITSANALVVKRVPISADKQSFSVLLMAKKNKAVFCPDIELKVIHESLDNYRPNSDSYEILENLFIAEKRTEEVVKLEGIGQGNSDILRTNDESSQILSAVIFNTNSCKAASFAEYCNYALKSQEESDVIMTISKKEKVNSCDFMAAAIRKHLTLKDSGIKTFRPFSFLPQLTLLNISKNPIEKIDGISNLVNLKSLNLSYTNVSDITELRNAYSLNYLNLRGTKVYDLSGIENLPNLKKIDLSNTRIKSINPIKKSYSIKCVIMKNTVIEKANQKDVDSLLDWAGRC